MHVGMHCEEVTKHALHHTWPRLIEINRMCPAISFLLSDHLLSMIIIRGMDRIFVVFAFLGVLCRVLCLLLCTMQCAHFWWDQILHTLVIRTTALQNLSTKHIHGHGHSVPSSQCLRESVSLYVCATAAALFSLESDWFYARWFLCSELLFYLQQIPFFPTISFSDPLLRRSLIDCKYVVYKHHSIPNHYCVFCCTLIWHRGPLRSDTINTKAKG